MTAVPPHEFPSFRVVKGSPTEEEVAVLAVVLAALRSARSPVPAKVEDSSAVRRSWRQRTWQGGRASAATPVTGASGSEELRWRGARSRMQWHATRPPVAD